MKVLNISIDRENMAQMNEDIWLKVVDYFSLGIVVSGEVSEHASFGFFVELKHPDLQNSFVGLVSITEFSDSAPITIADFPEVGTLIQAVVLGHRSYNQQIWLGMKKSYFV